MPTLHERVRQVETEQAAHGQQLGDHQRILQALEAHLDKLVEHIANLEKKALLIAGVLLIGSPTADKVAVLVGHLFA